MNLPPKEFWKTDGKHCLVRYEFVEVKCDKSRITGLTRPSWYRYKATPYFLGLPREEKSYYECFNGETISNNFGIRSTWKNWERENMPARITFYKTRREAQDAIQDDRWI